MPHCPSCSAPLKPAPEDGRVCATPGCKEHGLRVRPFAEWKSSGKDKPVRPLPNDLSRRILRSIAEANDAIRTYPDGTDAPSF